jgi:hypothetical protein
MFRKALAVAAVLLAAFHGWLFAGQLWNGQLADLAVLLRWLVAGGLVWGLYGLRRQGAPMFFGRKAVALWLLAALLHGPAVAERVGAPGIPALPEVVATIAKVALGAAALVGLILLTGLAVATRRKRPVVASRTRSSHALQGALSPGTYFLFAPRPPPVL